MRRSLVLTALALGALLATGCAAPTLAMAASGAC